MVQMRKYVINMFDNLTRSILNNFIKNPIYFCSAIVEVYRSGDVFNGKIVWLRNPTEADGTPAVDKNNPDSKLRSRHLIGLNMLSGLKKNGSEYSGGNIYDPANGKTYYCTMKVEGNTLKVRGSLDKRGFLGRTMDWFRVK